MIGIENNMTDNSPFCIFMIHDIWKTTCFTVSNLHLFFVVLFVSVSTLGLLFRFTSNNIVHNILFSIWDMVNDLLNEGNKGNEGEYNRYNWVFFGLFLLMLMSNILSRLPGFIPATSLLVVSLPLHLAILIYFLYFSLQLNGKKIIDVFFNREILLPIRIFIGIMEILSFFAKAFSFSIRLLANITAGHVLMWVIEKFVVDMPFYFKPIPFIFLVGMYIMEFAVAFLQSYVFLLLSSRIFKSVEHPAH